MSISYKSLTEMDNVCVFPAQKTSRFNTNAHTRTKENRPKDGEPFVVNLKVPLNLGIPFKEIDSTEHRKIIDLYERFMSADVSQFNFVEYLKWYSDFFDNVLMSRYIGMQKFRASIRYMDGVRAFVLMRGGKTEH